MSWIQLEQKMMVDCWEKKWNKGVLPTWRADTRVVATQFVASPSLSRLSSAISQEDHCPQFAIPLSLQIIFLGIPPLLTFQEFLPSHSDSAFTHNAGFAIDHHYWPQFLATRDAEIETASDAELCWEQNFHHAFMLL